MDYGIESKRGNIYVDIFTKEHIYTKCIALLEFYRIPLI